MLTVKLTEEEIRNLIQIVDIAVKAQGLSVAEAAVTLAKKLAEAMVPQPAPKG